MSDIAFDYIIVGAGSAGCVLAERLSRSSDVTIAVIEAGGHDRHLWIKLPIGYGRTFFDERVNWKFSTRPVPGCAGRTIYVPRGKVVGGSSSINALVYYRGQKSDFEDWARAGADGWGWEDVKPHFEALERRICDDDTPKGCGLMSVTDVSRHAHPVTREFIAGVREAGIPVSHDLNEPESEGVGYYHLTTRRGLRCSAADAFLRPALARGNVTLFTNTQVQKILFSGREAIGVSATRHAQQITLRARAETILSAGAIGSPQLLQLSGVGPASLLKQFGLPVVHDNPDVGGNLQDHVAISYLYKCRLKTLNNQLSPWYGKVWAGIRYALLRDGPLSLSVNQCGGFVRSSESMEHPDQQLYFTPTTYTTAPHGKRPIVNPDPFAGFLASFQPTRPLSRGRVDIQARDITQAPLIQPNYLADTADVRSVLSGAALLRTILQTERFSSLIRQAITPDIRNLDDEHMLDDFRQRCDSVYHPVSTCAMGKEKRGGVVDPRLRVYGVSKLRVVDASVFPTITSGNTNAPTLMVAHKAGGMIAQDRR